MKMGGSSQSNLNKHPCHRLKRTGVRFSPPLADRCCCAARQFANFFANKAHLEGGAFMSYGPDIIVESFRLAAAHVDKILKGAKASRLTVEQPTKFELAINLRT
jgi:hypothetical protein